MRAWPAADELQTDGVVDAVLGVAMLATALALGANPLWLIAPAAVLFVLARTPIRHMTKELASAQAAPVAVSVRGRWLVFARQAPEPLFYAGVVGVATAMAIPPVGLGLCGVVSLFGAAISLGRARVIGRWQDRHGERVVRTGRDLWTTH